MNSLPFFKCYYFGKFGSNTYGYKGWKTTSNVGWRSPITLSHRDWANTNIYIYIYTCHSSFLKSYTEFVPELKRQSCQERARKEEDILFLYTFFFNKRLYVMNVNILYPKPKFKKLENFRSKKYSFRNSNIKPSDA